MAPNKRSLAFGLPVLLGLLVLAWFVKGERQPRLNVVLVCLDTVRYDTFWLPESAQLDDPLTAFATRAVRFRNAYSVSPWTVPSLASVMTGLYPERHQAGQLPGPVHDLSREIPTSLPTHLPTLPALLHEAGYRTAHFSSHPWTAIAKFGLGRGFQEEIKGKDEKILEEVFRWLLRHDRSQPFFLNLHFMAAHDWYRQPIPVIRENLEELDAELAAAARSSAPYSLPSEPDRASYRYLEYVRSVSYLRSRLAKLVATLTEAGLLSSTIVFVYSDHGEEFRDHLEQERRDASDPRKFYGAGHGHTLYQEQLRIPMLAWVPGQKGTDFEDPVSHIDVAPTLLSWLGLSRLSPRWDGIDLSSHVAGLAKGPLDRPLFATGIAYGPPSSAVVLGNWKLIRSGGNDRLFDIAADPKELRPLQDSHPETVLELARLLDRRGAPLERLLPPSITREELERLRSLGYVSNR